MLGSKLLHQERRVIVMEAKQFTVETYIVIGANGLKERGYCVKHGDDTLVDFKITNTRPPRLAKAMANKYLKANRERLT
jgi:hypothetical protein